MPRDPQRSRDPGRPPALLSGRDRSRLLRLGSMLVIVLMLTVLAADPANWTWLFPKPPGPGPTLEEIAFDVQVDDPQPLRGDAFRAAANDATKAEPAPERPPADDANGWPAGLFDAVEDNTLALRAAERASYFAILDRLRSRPEAARTAGESVAFPVLMTEPNRYRGRLVRLDGVARRAVEIPAGPNEFGLEKLYDVWVFTPDSGLNPWHVVTTALPADLPRGEWFAEGTPVRVDGVFFKRQGYETGRHELHVAPLLLAATADRVVASPSPVAQSRRYAPYVLGALGGLTVLAGPAAVADAAGRPCLRGPHARPLPRRPGCEGRGREHRTGLADRRPAAPLAGRVLQDPRRRSRAALIPPAVVLPRPRVATRGSPLYGGGRTEPQRDARPLSTQGARGMTASTRDQDTPTRETVPAAGRFPLTWELTSLLPAPQTDAFREELANYRVALETLAAASDALPPVAGDPGTATAWVAFLNDYAAVSAKGTDLNALIGCYAAADAENPLYQTLEAKLSALDPLRSAVATNVEFALKTAAESTFEAFVSADPVLTANRFHLEDARRLATLRLPKDQERLAAELDVDGFSAWGRLYDRVSGALKITVIERGELVQKSPGQVTYDSPERTVRQNNFYSANKAWKSVADTAADCLNHLAGTRLTKYKRLGLTNHLDAPLLHNRMSRETLETMWQVVAQRRGVLTSYFDRKASLLGLNKLAWYDLTAPLPTGAKPASKLPYDEACDTVIRTLGGFSPEFGSFAETSLKDRWVEVENRAGKRQGGFCTGFPTAGQSRIFMTYTESADSMSTLAHELGHAYHSHVLNDEPYFLRDYPMNLAETASTFAEQILNQEQLDVAADPAAQRVILDQMLGDAVAFCMNIHTRFVFEERFHRERAEGELSAERLSALMLDAQKECYCGGLADDGYNPLFWASKLHFYITYVPFYNFPYTFGYLLSLGLYAIAREGAADFPAQYREFLRGTGRMTAEQAVQTAFGYDLRRPEFWQKSMDVIESRVERFVKS